MVSATSRASSLVITPRLSSSDLPKEHAYTLKPGRPTPGQHNLLRPPIASYIGTGILTCFPSATLLSLTLGADSPCADERCAGNLGFSARGLFTPFIATHVSIRTSDISSIHYQTPSQTYRTLLYHMHKVHIRSFGYALCAYGRGAFCKSAKVSGNGCWRYQKCEC